MKIRVDFTVEIPRHQIEEAADFTQSERYVDLRMAVADEAQQMVISYFKDNGIEMRLVKDGMRRFG